MKNEVTFLGIINDEKYGKLAHFFSDSKGNYFSRVIEEDEMIIYDELSKKEQQELLDKIASGDKFENQDK